MQIELIKNEEVIFTLNTEEENVTEKVKEFREKYASKLIDKIELTFQDNVDLNIANDILSDCDHEGIKLQRIFLK